VKEIFRKIQQDTDLSRETRTEKGEKSFFFLDIPKTLREIRSSDPEKKGGRKPVAKVLASLAVQSVESVVFINGVWWSSSGSRVALSLSI
jgi:hypothetical protein